jgi:hypothetical protein
MSTLRRNCPHQQVIEGKIKGGIEMTGIRGRRRRKLLDVQLVEQGDYSSTANCRAKFPAMFGVISGISSRLFNIIYLFIP